jgi:predicted nucleic acid-binding Zn ribbon protein
MERIGGDVERELERFGPAAGMAAIVAAWPAAVGDTNARRAWPARLARDGTLHVTAADSTWAFQLTHLAPQILEALRATLGEAAPAALRFAPGRVPEPPAKEPAGAVVDTARPSAEERAVGAAIAAGIADSDLRDLVARAAAASLARAAASR